jgi:hypothetical protein
VNEREIIFLNDKRKRKMALIKLFNNFCNVSLGYHPCKLNAVSLG